MFAIVETGGKQYKVSKGDVLSCEKIDANVGETVTLGNVMLVSGQELLVGEPYLGQVQVKAHLLEQKRGEKIIIFKKRRRKNFRRKTGHRQELSVLKIVDIQID